MWNAQQNSWSVYGVKSQRWKQDEDERQMHTIEALLALMPIIGVVAFTARSAPGETQVGGSMDTQLVLYGNDFLSILDMEQPDHKSWLYDFVETIVLSKIIYTKTE